MNDSYLFWKRFDDSKPYGVTLKDICSEVGLVYQRIADQRSDCRLPKLDDAFLLSSRIGVSLEYLLTGCACTSSRQEKLSPRSLAIALACERASDLELTMVEKILDISPPGKNTGVQMTS